MRRAWKLGSLFGIEIFVHLTWLLLPLIYLGAGFFIGLIQSVFLLILLVSVFGCVVLHELGHALMARYFGIGTRDITLYPIGGVARLEGMPERPYQELLVAVAGPAVNVVIALLLTPIVLGALWADRMPPLDAEAALAQGFSATLMLYVLFTWFINVCLVLFNMLPIFPMDGGRVLRALLAMRLSLVRATEWSVRFGRIVILGAIAFALIWQRGFLQTHPMLLVVSVFVFVAGQQELSAVRQRFARRRELLPPRPILPPYASGGLSDSSLTGIRWDPTLKAWIWGQMVIYPHSPPRAPDKPK